MDRRSFLQGSLLAAAAPGLLAASGPSGKKANTGEAVADLAARKRHLAALWSEWDRCDDRIRAEGIALGYSYLSPEEVRVKPSPPAPRPVEEATHRLACHFAQELGLPAVVQSKSYRVLVRVLVPGTEDGWQTIGLDILRRPDGRFVPDPFRKGDPVPDDAAKYFLDLRETLLRKWGMEPVMFSQALPPDNGLEAHLRVWRDDRFGRLAKKWSDALEWPLAEHASYMADRAAKALCGYAAIYGLPVPHRVENMDPHLPTRGRGIWLHLPRCKVGITREGDIFATDGVVRKEFPNLAEAAKWLAEKEKRA